MSQNAQRDMSGILFKNDRKEQDSHADYNGTATINGEEFWMNAWLKKGAKGNFMSFSFRPKTAKQSSISERAKATPPQRDAPMRRREELDDEVPF
jgi:hypothetical protein